MTSLTPTGAGGVTDITEGGSGISEVKSVGPAEGIKERVGSRHGGHLRLISSFETRMAF